MNPIIDELEKSYLRENLPETNPGDTVKVFVRRKQRKNSGFRRNCY